MYEKLFLSPFTKIITLYENKVKRKGVEVTSVYDIIQWMTGYDQKDIVSTEKNVKAFFEDASHMNPLKHSVYGVICGIRVENLEPSLIKDIRILDKLIDDLSKGKTIHQILRKYGIDDGL